MFNQVHFKSLKNKPFGISFFHSGLSYTLLCICYVDMISTFVSYKNGRDNVPGAFMFISCFYKIETVIWLTLVFIY